MKIIQRWVTPVVISALLISSTASAHADCSECAYDTYYPYDPYCHGHAYCETTTCAIFYYGGYFLLFAGVAAIIAVAFLPTGDDSNSH